MITSTRHPSGETFAKRFHSLGERGRAEAQKHVFAQKDPFQRPPHVKPILPKDPRPICVGRHDPLLYSTERPETHVLDGRFLVTTSFLLLLVRHLLLLAWHLFLLANLVVTLLRRNRHLAGGGCRRRPRTSGTEAAGATGACRVAQEEFGGPSKLRQGGQLKVDEDQFG